MCGFVGAIGPGLDLSRALPWLRRRGPDSQRLWSSADGRVALLHARLAIVDRDERAHQPLASDDGAVAVTLVGEIYNYQEVKADLQGFPFRTTSDTEVVLAAYLRYGREAFSQLKGMFTIAVVDERAGRVFLVRDAMGKKPLYLAQWGGVVLFGSSVLPLVAVRGAAASVDLSVLPQYWEHAFVPPAMSVVQGVKPVLPGDLLELDWNGGVIGHSRCEPASQLVYGGEPASEIRRNVATLLSQAVARRLHNNPQPTALLSGGIDSTLVTLLAGRAASASGDHAPLQTLTLGAVIPLTQDEGYARYAARRLGLSLQVLRTARGRLSERILGALAVQDEPLGMPSYFLLHQLVEAAGQFGRVLLTGDGGDEVFLGYRPTGDWHRPPGDPPCMPAVQVGPGPVDWMSPWARQVTGDTLLGHMFTKADRASAEQGVEIRCPLLDWDLVAYARSLPFEILAGDGRNKALLKDQLAGWPRWFLERRKLGFAFNLRWRWGLLGFDGLRESVDREAVETFGELVPEPLRTDPSRWGSRDIFANFGAAWRLMTWSLFMRRLSSASVSEGTRLQTVSGI